ncbi:DNA topoisomerase 1-like [Atheta coriaria]|uniref:DNA topoisomerase 1-like n=1 Tax=Dalotia coriaria TaxID=877792 RepID=UPI0031F3D74B
MDVGNSATEFVSPSNNDQHEHDMSNEFSSPDKHQSSKSEHCDKHRDHQSRTKDHKSSKDKDRQHSSSSKDKLLAVRLYTSKRKYDSKEDEKTVVQSKNCSRLEDNDDYKDVKPIKREKKKSKSTPAVVKKKPAGSPMKRKKKAMTNCKYGLGA